eukprot:5815899-Prymnesium_polylepis.1
MRIGRRDGCVGARSPRASVRGEHSATRSRAAAVISPPFTRRPSRRPAHDLRRRDSARERGTPRAAPA